MSALPQIAEVIELQPEPEFSLSRLVRECVENADEPDRDAVIEEVIAAIGAERYEAALRQALPHVIGRIAAVMRHNDREGRETSSGRWDDVAKKQGTGALAIYRWWISLDPAQPPKFFGDCTQPEVEQVAALYKKRALDMANQAQRFAAVAKTMKERGAETVQEIPVERLVEIFNA